MNARIYYDKMAFSHDRNFVTFVNTPDSLRAALRMLTEAHGEGRAGWSHRPAAEGRMCVLAAGRDTYRVRLQAAETARLQALPVHCRAHALLNSILVA